MKLALNEARVQQTIHKNTATSYGLTLVAGLPFPAEIGDRVQAIQAQLEALAPGRFTWYRVDHLHATLFAPLRGRYRDSPPLQRDELPADIQGFTQKLNDFFAQQQPYALDLAGVSVTRQGFVMVGECTLVRQLASSLRQYPELDPPKHLRGSHIAIGFLNTQRPFAREEEKACFEQALAQFRDIQVGKTLVQQVWLVHYANRTLNQILGKVPFTLGQANVMTVERLLRELGIATA
jgi:hypothetical protein